jgi:hypothetical protein
MPRTRLLLPREVYDCSLIGLSLRPRFWVRGDFGTPIRYARTANHHFGTRLRRLFKLAKCMGAALQRKCRLLLRGKFAAGGGGKVRAEFTREEIGVVF